MQNRRIAAIRSPMPRVEGTAVPQPEPSHSDEPMIPQGPLAGAAFAAVGWRVVRRRWQVLMPTAAVTALVLAIADTALAVWVFGSVRAAGTAQFDVTRPLVAWMNDPQGTTAPLAKAVTAIIATTVLLPMVATAAAAAVVTDVQIGAQATWRECLRRAMAAAPACVSATMAAAAVAGTPLVVVGLAIQWVPARAGQTALLLLGAAPALVWMVFATVRLSLAPQAVVMEGLNPWAGLRRAWGLTRASAVRVAVITITASFIAAILGALLAVPVTALGTLASAGETEAGAGKMLAEHFLRMSVTTLVGVVGTGVVAALLFIDLRRRQAPPPAADNLPPGADEGQ